MKEKLKTLLTRNIGMKLLSFVLAFFIWIIIMSVSDPTVTKKIDGIQIETRNKDTYNNQEANKDLSIEIMTSGSLSIKISGKRSEIEELSAYDFIAYADFNDFVAVNAIPIKIEPRNSELKDHYELTYQSKDVLQVNMVKSRTETLDVSVEKLNVPDDYYALAISDNKSISVTGPEKLVESIDYLLAKADISKLTGKFIYAPLVAIDKSGNEIHSDSLEFAMTQTRVVVELLPIKEVPIRMNYDETEIAEGFAIYAKEETPSKVRIAAKEETLNSIREIEIPYITEEPLIKATDLKPITRDFAVKDYIGSDVYLLRENVVVSTSIQVEALSEKEFTVPKSKIEYRNLPNDYEIPVDFKSTDGKEEEITILVRGFKSDLDSITSYTELKLYADLSTIQAGGIQKFTIQFEKIERLSGRFMELEGEVELNVHHSR